MSLRDTIEGARREAEGNAVGRPKKEAENMASGEEEKKGFSRSSAAKAKPTREAAASVRVASKPKQTGAVGGPAETKEEKRERKRREREEQDLRTRAYDVVLRNTPEYRSTERGFWIVVGVGFALAVISLIAAYAFGSEPDLSTVEGVVSVVSLVAAYALIIGGFVFDLAKRRPIRKRVEAQLRGNSDKKLLEILEQDRGAQLSSKGKKK